MPTLYHLHLSRHVYGMSKGPVRAIAAQGLVFDLAEDGSPIVPDRGAIRECLPACYRKAFDRAAGSFSEFSGRTGIFIRLNNSRGKYLNTIYAIPDKFSRKFAD